MDFPDGSEIKTLHFKCKGQEFDPWSRTNISSVARCGQKRKKSIENQGELVWQNASLRSRTVNQGVSLGILRRVVYDWEQLDGEVTASLSIQRPWTILYSPLGLKTGRIEVLQGDWHGTKSLYWISFEIRGWRPCCFLWFYGISVPGGEVTRFFKVIFIGMTNLNIPGILWPQFFNFFGGIFLGWTVHVLYNT